MEGRLNRLINAGTTTLLSVAIAAGCNADYINRRPYSKSYQTPESTPQGETLRKDPTPSPYLTPEITPHIESAPNPNMRTYFSGLGFSFQFPDYLFLDRDSTSNRIKFLQEQNDINAQRLLVEVAQSDLSLSDYARARNLEHSWPYPIAEEQLILDGHEALALTTVFSKQQLCNTGSNEEIKRVKYLLIKDGERIITFNINDSCYTVGTDWFSQIPPTIRFDEQSV